VVQELSRQVLRKRRSGSSLLIRMNLDVGRDLALFRELIVCNAGMWRAGYDLRGNARLKLPKWAYRARANAVDVRVGSMLSKNASP
jgi:hypothetical protein